MAYPNVRRRIDFTVSHNLPLIVVIARIGKASDYLQSRVPVLVNNDCHIVLAAPTAGMKDYFYKNTDAM